MFSSLRTDPQLWLDNVSGSHALVAHTDASFGLERETNKDGDFYVLSGVRRNGLAPLIVLQSNPETLRFEPLDDLEQMETAIFTVAQRQLWRNLPGSFTWSQAEELAHGSKHLLSDTIRKATENGLLEHAEGQPYRKRLRPRKITEQAA